MKKILICDRLLFDTEMFAVTSMDGKTIRLSKMEVLVLSLLCSHSGKTVTRQFLFDNAWKNGTGNDGHLNRVILLLRRKFESLGAIDIIMTIPKVGYSISQAIEAHDSKSFIEKENGIISIENNDFAVIENIIHNDEILNLSASEKTIANPSNSRIKKKSNKLIFTSIILSLLVISGGYYFAYFFYKPQVAIKQSKQKITLDVERFTFHNSRLYSSSTLSSSDKKNIQDLIKSTPSIEGYTHYFGISNQAISVVVQDLNGNPLLSSIFIRNDSSLQDQFTCILRYSQKTPPQKSYVSADAIDSSHGVVTKKMRMSIYLGCPADDESSLLWNLKLTYPIKHPIKPAHDGYLYFFFSSNFYNYKNQRLIEVSSDGYILNEINNGILHNRFHSKTSDINQVNDNIEGLVSYELLMLVLAELRRVEYVTDTFKINTKVYYSNFMGGVVLTFL